MRKFLCVTVIAFGALLLAAGPAYANTISIGPQSMEGALQIHAGDWIAAGYVFKIPGSHPATTVGFANATVTLPVSCTSGGSLAGTITINLSGGPYNVPLNSSTQFPATNQSDPLSYEGSVQAPDLCGGNVMFAASNSPTPGGGATFSADLQSTQSNNISVAFHYRDANAKGQGNLNCADPNSNPFPADNGPCGGSLSATTAFAPDVTDTPVPMGAIGGLGLAGIVGVAFGFLQRRRRPRAAATRSQ